MRSEKINRIELLPTGELLLGLEGCGKPDYQYVYREAAGVYWDPDLKGFKSTDLKNWTVLQWYVHIVDVVRGVGIELELGDTISWRNLSDSEQEAIAKGTLVK